MGKIRISSQGEHLNCLYRYLVCKNCNSFWNCHSFWNSFFLWFFLHAPIQAHLISTKTPYMISFSTQLSLNFIINGKMPAIFGIFTFISRLNTIYDSFKVSKILIFHHLCRSILNVMLSWAEHENNIYNLEIMFPIFEKFLRVFTYYVFTFIFGSLSL